MILLDSRVGSIELKAPLLRLGLPVEVTSLEFGDACFEGNGPQGSLAVGIERKTLGDMLHCIEDKRFAGHQLPGMRGLYDLSILLVEGHWRPYDPDGFLMESHNGVTWGYSRSAGQRTTYSKLFRYLLSVQMSGAYVCCPRTLFESAYQIHEWYHHLRKRWADHGALLEMHAITLPSLRERPSLVRRWAKELDGIGVKLSDAAARTFKTPRALADADESEWLKVPGVGVKTAQSIYREVLGLKG